MDKKDIFRAIGDIDDHFIEEAAGSAGKKNKVVPFRKYKSLVAVASLVICVGVGYLAFAQPKSNTAMDGMALTAPSSVSNNAATAQEATANDAPMVEETYTEAATDDSVVAGIREGNGGLVDVTEDSFAGVSNTEASSKDKQEEAIKEDDKKDLSDYRNYENLEEVMNLPEFRLAEKLVVPSEFALVFAIQENDRLGLRFTREDQSTFSVQVYQADENVSDHYVLPQDTELYDWGLYAVPFEETVPEEYRQRMELPVFDRRELDLDVVQRRQLLIEEFGGGISIRFGILYPDNQVMEISSTGLSPEEVMALLYSE